MSEDWAKAVEAWAKPANTLIERFSIGRLYDPRHARNMNKAYNENRLRDAKTDLEIAQIEADAKQVRDQTNCDSIVYMAASMLTDDAKPEKIDQDIINVLQNDMKVVENEEMRRMYANILSEEATRPGSFSKRVLHEVSCLSKEDAEAFTTLAGYVWTLDIDGRPHPFLVIDEDTRKTIHIPSTLLDANLIRYGGVSRRFLQDFEGKEGTFQYYERKCIMRLVSNKGIYVGDLVLTSIGQSLFPVCGGSPVNGVFDKMVEQWAQGTDVDVLKIAP